MSGTPGRSKYGARKVVTSLGTFDSMAEYADAQMLETMRLAGEIWHWSREVRAYVLIERSATVRRQTTYRPDFHVCISDARCVDIESKRGVQTAVSRLKHKLMAERYPDVPLLVVRKGESLRAKLLRLGEGS